MQSARQTCGKTNSSHNLTRLFPYNGNRSKALSPHTNITIKSGFLKELEYADRQLDIQWFICELTFLLSKMTRQTQNARHSNDEVNVICTSQDGCILYPGYTHSKMTRQTQNARHSNDEANVICTSRDGWK
ncbi:hypothetical protein Glove_750g3 [Diversispora epigaea]|uniref:Uncharacterized protein n=1 Tax=Diversispora epigaea TaxID=1348612 RepID=A0A397G3N9_9GLOM|nr:hypothetical protein Glove_750g3 [Diversispora epigaea]